MKDWIRKVAIKTVKTMAETAVGVIGSSAILADINWSIVGSSVVVSGIICILMNISQIEED